MANNYDYQYETSPRKLEPDYDDIKTKKKNVNKKTKKKVQNKTKNNKKNKKQHKFSFEFKFFINSMLFFAVVFSIIACQALVEQKYKEKENLKLEYSNLLASNNLLKDTDDIRIVATEYGMQTKSATLIDLGTSDYIESSMNQVELNEDGIFDKIVEWFKNIF